MGRRVSIRRVVERAADGRLLQGDVVGDLLSHDGQTVVVDTRTGLVEVPLALVTIAKVVPPSTAEDLSLEAIAARGLRAAETAQVGGWLLRANHGLTRRANSVLPLRQLGMPRDDALAQARAWYTERGLPLLIAAPTEARRLLDAELGERGWNPVGESHVLACRLDQVPDSTSDGSADAVEFAGSPDDDWLARFRPGDPPVAVDIARELVTRHDRVVFASVRVAGHTVAVGRGAVDDDWLSVSAVEVDAAARRQGHGTAILRALRTWGREQGALRSYLQVQVENDAALALYRGLGYWPHHDYRYREDPETTPEPTSADGDARPG